MATEVVFNGRFGTASSSAESFVKCTRWQVEETTDLINCPYHYFCASTYLGDYPSIADFSVILFFLASLVSAMVLTLLEFRSIRRSFLGSFRSWRRRRCFLPSGPIVLPLTLFILANGLRINKVFPLTQFGPALLLLVQVSAMAFRNKAEKDINYALMESWTISGILHASLHLDSIILPYYTGLEAMTMSTSSGLCPSCVCRTEALVVGGGSLIRPLFRGWSNTAFSITGALCARMACRIFTAEGIKMAVMIKFMMEGISWYLIAGDSIRLIMAGAPPKGTNGSLCRVVYGGICVLIFLNLLKMTFQFFVWIGEKHQRRTKIDLYQSDFVGIA